MKSAPTIGSVTPAQTDEAVRDVAAAAARGSMPETTARGNIAILLAHSDAVGREVGAYLGKNQQASSAALDAIRSECERLLTEKVTNPEASSAFDIDQALISSPVGWASNLLRAARASTTAKVENSLKESASDRLPESEDGLWSSMAKPSTSDYSKAEIMLSVYDWLSQRQSTRSQSPREAEKAHAFMAAFELPEPLRPHWRDRREVHRILSEDPQAAWHAAAAQYLAVGGSVRADVDESIDARVASLWDDYTPAQLGRLVLKDFRAAPLLASVYTADFARPSAAETKKLIAEAARATDHHRDKPVLREAARAMIEVEFSTEPLNPSTMDDETRAKRAEIQRHYTAAADELFAAVAELEGHPLGETPDAVYRGLYAIAAPFTRERTWTLGGGEDL